MSLLHTAHNNTIKHLAMYGRATSSLASSIAHTVSIYEYIGCSDQGVRSQMLSMEYCCTNMGGSFPAPCNSEEFQSEKTKKTRSFKKNSCEILGLKTNIGNWFPQKLLPHLCICFSAQLKHKVDFLDVTILKLYTKRSTKCWPNRG